MAEQFEKFNDMEVFLDMQRCIGCHSCEMACAECETNGETTMIHIHYVDRRETVQTTVQVCMHCDDPICANVCPADAIVKDEYGIVHSADVSKCIGCANCVLSCPFGVPKIPDQNALLMQKCNMCYDRTSVGLKPMCATVCPSGALTFDTKENVAKKRPNSTPIKKFIFGEEVVTTKVNLMMPKGSEEIKVF